MGTLHPAGTDFDAVGDHPVVGLVVGLLLGVGNDIHRGPEGECFEVALAGAGSRKHHENAASVPFTVQVVSNVSLPGRACLATAEHPRC